MVWTRLFLRALECAVLGLTALAASTVARADVVTVTASGTVAASCSMSANQSFGTPNLSTHGSATAQATVNCNTGFRLTALSANGAIKNITSPTTPPAGTVNAVPYTLTVGVLLDNSTTVTSPACNSSSLVAGQSSCSLSPANTTGLSSGGKSSTNRAATLTLAWAAPTSMLIAGDYADTITLMIGTAP